MDINELKKLAGINEFKGYSVYDPYGGSNVSLTGNEKGEIMKKNDIKPGTDGWFRLWFSKPYLTGEKPI